ncbi:MAG: trimethylamine methyltransferase family protein [Candidatus Latescibacteria bacterium]|nr:trimethylamine methyltransferase family protein [Candidatus Latescibacterota bacterium]
MNLTVLGKNGVSLIDEAARNILWRTGVEIPHQEMLKLFYNAGAEVDSTSGRIKIPSKLVDECLKTSGKKFTLYGRDRNQKASFGAGKRNYNSIAGEAHWIDNHGNRRFATFDDVEQAARLGDVLPQLNIVGAMADPHEVDISYRCVEVAARLLRTTTKPVTFWFFDRPSAAFIIELFTVLNGTKENLALYPPTYPFLEPISPLRFPKDGIDLLFETCRVPLPVPVGPMAQVGMSAPGTLAGTIAQETAEILAGICVTQLIHPGTPVCFGGIPHAFDMRTTQMIFAGPEQGLMAIAMTEMGKYYDLPVYINVGLTDSKCVDAQAGLEIGSTLLMGALSGADIFGHLGIAGVDQASSLGMLVFQHEVIEYIERIMRSFTVDDETLALDVIDKVGPGGVFIAEEHTVRHFREEIWMPTLLDRNYWPTWEKLGRHSVDQNVKERVEELLASYKPCPLSENEDREFDKILDSARKTL